MTTIVTSTSDPSLWARLAEQCSYFKSNWAVAEGVSYRLLENVDGDVFFEGYTQTELMDTRSMKGRKATYKNMDR